MNQKLNSSRRGNRLGMQTGRSAFCSLPPWRAYDLQLVSEKLLTLFPYQDRKYYLRPSSSFWALRDGGIFGAWRKEGALARPGAGRAAPDATLPLSSDLAGESCAGDKSPPGQASSKRAPRPTQAHSWWN